MLEWMGSNEGLEMAVDTIRKIYRVDVPQTAVEWADENFYLSAESSGTVGRWATLPYQVAILNCMGGPDVQRVFVFKSARVGYTKMLLAVVGYFLIKRRRSVCMWQPTDGNRNEFTKDEVDTAIWLKTLFAFSDVLARVAEKWDSYAKFTFKNIRKYTPQISI